MHADSLHKESLEWPENVNNSNQRQTLQRSEEKMKRKEKKSRSIRRCRICMDKALWIIIYLCLFRGALFAFRFNHIFIVIAVVVVVG